MNCLTYITTNNNNYVRIHNNGGFVAQFYLSYFLSGRRITQDSGLFYIGQIRQLSIPDGASNPYLVVIARIFGNFVTVFNNYIPSISPSCFVMEGTILNPSIKQIPCSQLGTTLPNQCCCK